MSQREGRRGRSDKPNFISTTIAEDAEGPDIEPEPSLNFLAKEMRSMRVFMQNIAGDTSTIKKSVSEVQSAITVLTDRVGEAEGRIVKMEERTDSFAETLQTTLRQLEMVKQRVENLDNRGWHNNLRILGIPEDAEGNNMIQFLQNEIPKMLKHAFEGPLEIERAHRALAPKPREGQRPRAITLKLLRFQIKFYAEQGRCDTWHGTNRAS
ncbi:UNVERIFIED_CONTAM: hypothetical protein FKN15_045156 [Acipenser sinensis]